METHWEEPDGKITHSSVDVEGSEADLTAIPDSAWKSDSTLRGSPQDVEDIGERKLSLHEKVKASWFLGGDDENKEVQTQTHSTILGEFTGKY